LRPGSRAQVWDNDTVILRSGRALIRIFKEKGGFKIIMPDSERTVVLKGTVVEVAIDEDGRSTIKLIEGEADIIDLNENLIETLNAGEKIESATNEKITFNAETALAEWQETGEPAETDQPSQTGREGEDGSGKKDGFSNSWLWLIAFIAAGAGGAGWFFFKKSRSAKKGLK
jgi:hypothetical protein